MFINSPCGFTLAVFPYNVTDKNLNSDPFINVMNVCFYNVRYDSFIPVLIPFIENVGCPDYGEKSWQSGQRVYGVFFQNFSQTVGSKCVSQTLVCV